MAPTDGIGSVHVYDWDALSYMPEGWRIGPLPGAPGLTDVIVGHERTAHGTTFHTTVRMREADAIVIGRDRFALLRAAKHLARLSDS